MLPLMILLLLIGLLGFKLRVAPSLWIGLGLVTLLLSVISHNSPLPALVLLFFLAPLLLALNNQVWRSGLFCLAILLPQLMLLSR
ncbi:MAG: hypothetical protein ACRC9S_04075 [Vibrio sp.]